VAAPLKELGAHPDGGAITIMPGKYGPYVKWAKVNAPLPKEMTPDSVTLEQALALIADKAPAKKAPAKKAAAKKPAAKAAVKKPATKTSAKPAAKKPAAKKPAAKKPATISDDVID
jgi:DNA topoisomerase-1